MGGDSSPDLEEALKMHLHGGGGEKKLSEPPMKKNYVQVFTNCGRWIGAPVVDRSLWRDSVGVACLSFECVASSILTEARGFCRAREKTGSLLLSDNKSRCCPVGCADDVACTSNDLLSPGVN